MRIFLLLAVCGAFLLAPSVSAQKTVQAWYGIEYSEDVQVVQARVLETVRSRSGQMRVLADGRVIARASGELQVVFLGTDERPPRETPQNAMDSGWFTGGTTNINIWSKIELVPGGSVIQTTIIENRDTGKQTTTTTTTTANGDGTVSTTTTTTESGGEGAGGGDTEDNEE